MRKSVLNNIEKALSLALVISTSAMILVVVLQIFARYALPWSPDWTEEMARFCFIYMVSLGAGLALKENAYVSVTTILGKFSSKGKLYMESLILGSVAMLMIIMLVYSIFLLNIVKLQTSAALQLNMALIYFSMVVMSFFVLLYSIIQLTEKLRHL